MKACLAALAALVIAAPISAAPVTLQCRMIGPDAATYGLLSVSVDLETRSVEVTSAKVPEVVWRWHDGETSSHLAKAPQAIMPYFPPVRQFVRVTASNVTLGWFPADDPAHEALASFNRSAVDAPGTPCLWHQTALRSRSSGGL